MKEYNILIIYSDELERNVKILVSLPKNYYKNDKTYPVLYMNAGQVLFNDHDDYMGENWGVMEGYMNNPNMPELVLIGIEGGETSTNELLPFTFNSGTDGEKLGGKTKEYMEFIVNTLKPIVNEKYRVFKTPENTGMLGISIGGVCTSYAAAKYTNHFKLFGCISSCFPPVIKDMVELATKTDYSEVRKIYMDIGTNESPTNDAVSKRYLDTNQEMYNILKEKIDPQKIKYEIIDDAQHNIPDWSKRFPSIIEYLFNE